MITRSVSVRSQWVARVRVSVILRLNSVCWLIFCEHETPTHSVARNTYHPLSCESVSHLGQDEPAPISSAGTASAG